MPNNPPPKAFGYVDGDKRKGPLDTTHLTFAEQVIFGDALRRSVKVVGKGRGPIEMKGNDNGA